MLTTIKPMLRFALFILLPTSAISSELSTSLEIYARCIDRSTVRQLLEIQAKSEKEISTLKRGVFHLITGQSMRDCNNEYSALINELGKASHHSNMKAHTDLVGEFIADNNLITVLTLRHLAEALRSVASAQK
ncbi:MULTISPECIES: hypothetical protein [unclassified Chelatococcus]|uniref:hypothetical protein n=1 Tax=unclassified Chelatococcus TaxID=2638111 RepID=UPI001BCC26E8|nr:MULTISPECIES: hypothetical protein [unclassified Chelatococcus]MBS7701587.1 hypothetical protein [Chelatococcus sp. YT9]MBX3557422.1 hypothetical protein [Chelatococcus sp.]